MAIHSLYNGTVELVFDERRHRYSVDGDWKPGVTTILGAAINKSDALVPWAAKTTVEYLRANVLPDTPYSTTEWDVLYEGAKAAHRLRKEEAGATGTLAHAWLEDYQRTLLYGISMPELPEDEQVRNAVHAPLAWMKEVQFTPQLIERAIYSREFGFAGTMDWKALIKGRVSVGDWKTPKALYLSNVWQMAAYQGAYEEETGEEIEARYAIRLDKVTGDFNPDTDVAEYTEREDYFRHWDCFKACCTVYRGLKEKLPTAL